MSPEEFGKVREALHDAGYTIPYVGVDGVLYTLDFGSDPEVTPADEDLRYLLGLEARH